MALRIVGIVFILLVGCVGVQEDEESGTVPSLPEGMFDQNDFSGNVFVHGYAETETVQEPFCDVDCEEFNYVFFHIMRTGNPELIPFLQDRSGNAFLDEFRIGLGCIEDGHIVYDNDADAFGRRSFSLSKEESTRILRSTERHPVTLELMKLPLAGGMGAPACYAHFTEVRIIDE